MKAKEYKLRPCPFCGRKARLQEAGSFGPVNQSPTFVWWEVECKCKVKTDIYSYKTWAVRAWNRRIK